MRRRLYAIARIQPDGFGSEDTRKGFSGAASLFRHVLITADMTKTGWALAVCLTGVVLGHLGVGGPMPPGGETPSDGIPVGTFSAMDPSRTLPSGWRSISMAAAYEATDYDLVSLEDRVAVRAQSDGGASLLATSAHVDLRDHPILEWRWRVEKTVEGGDVRERSHDDAPARIYVAFDHDLSLYYRLKITAYRAMGYESLGKRVIGYIWANRVEQHSVHRNPFFPWHRVIAVESGSEHAGTWLVERRNVRADYRRVFGEEAPPIEQVAILTDMDQTGETIRAYYGDIFFRPETGPEGPAPEKRLIRRSDAQQ